MIDSASIKLRYAALRGVLNGRGRRCFAAADAFAAGHSGIKEVSDATGIAAARSATGLRELRCASDAGSSGCIRRKGVGRKPLLATDPTLLSEFEKLVLPRTRGDPMSLPLR